MSLARLTVPTIVACLLAWTSIAAASISGSANLSFLKVGPSNGLPAHLSFNGTSSVDARVGQLIWDVQNDVGTPLPLINHGDSDALPDNLITFCIELTQYVGVAPYQKQSVDAVFGANRADLLDLLADNRWSEATGTDVTKAVAFQLAVWEIVYDASSLNVSSGTGFKVNSTNALAGAISLANDWLGLLTTGTMSTPKFEHDNNLSVFALTNSQKQDQLVQYATPVVQGPPDDVLPEPLSLMVWVGLLGACGAVSRRSHR